jgi:PAS domain S-box-containing protein
MMDLPVYREHGLQGILCLEQVGVPRVWQEDEQVFAHAAADCIGVARLIWELRESQEKLMLAHVEWERTFDALPDLVAIIDGDHRIVRVNRAMAERLKLTPEQCVGATCYEAVHGASGPISSCPHQMLLADGQPHEMEVIEERLGGAFFVTCTPLRDEQGKLVGSIHVARDITELRQKEALLASSEERYRQIVELAQDGILVIDAEANITFVNRRLVAMLGESADGVIERSLYDFMDEHWSGVCRQAMERCRQGINQEFDFEFRCRDGRRVIVELKTSAFFDAQRNFTGVMSLVRDVGEARKSEREIQGRMEEIEKLNRFMIGRELRIMEIKKEVNGLLAALAKPPKYRV